MLFLEIWLLGLEFIDSFLQKFFFELLMIESVTLLFVVYELLTGHKLLWIATMKFTWV